MVVCAAQRATSSPATSRPATTSSGRSSSRKAPSSKGSYQLCIRGRRIPLNVGSRLGAGQIAGLETKKADGAVAEVTAHPNDPKQLGLKNLSTRPWKATMPDGSRKDIGVGKNVRLVPGVEIDFGVLKGRIE